MFKVLFRNRVNTEHGTPYKACDIVVHGKYIPDTTGYQFVETYAVSQDFDYCFIGQWDLDTIDPGFVIWRLEEDEKTVKKSSRFSGLLDHIELISADSVRVHYSVQNALKYKLEKKESVIEF